MVQSTSERTGEFEIIANYFKDLTGQNGVVLGIGDDGAIVDEFIYSKDAFFENVHFKTSWMSYYQIAKKRRCHRDVAR